MEKEKKEGNVTLEVINEIFLEDTPEYHHIKELADKDIAKELMERIDKFLENRQKPEVKEIKKVIFEDASKVGDQSINDIVDAFVRMRSENTLGEVDRRSINDILILFNQWVQIGKGKQETGLPKDIFSESITERKQDKLHDLEEQIMTLREPAHEELYKMHNPSIALSPGQIYSSSSEREMIYDSGIASQFECCQDHDCVHYSSKSVYKTHGGHVNIS